MRAGCYTLHLYCDRDDCPRNDPNDPRWRDGPDEYTGETRQECDRKARADGWVLGRTLGHRCPDCATTETPSEESDDA